MAEELQNLLEKIKRDGVDKANAEAAAIVAKAKSDAESIVKEAETKAAAAKAAAEAEAKAEAVRAEETIRQAARDTVLKVGQSVTAMLEKGLGEFSKKMRCFGDSSALLTAPETRTSSPVRITRTDKLCSLSAENLYPAGEGAGYAGGIMSAAVDGLRCALKLMETQAP